MTRHVKLRIFSDKVCVDAGLRLPLGNDYEGYIEYDEQSGNKNFAMIFLDESQIATMKLVAVSKPVKFEVLRYIQSGDICIVDD